MRKKNVLIVLSVSAVIAAIVIAVSWEDVYIKEAKEAVLQTLKDPESANFKNVKGTYVEDDHVVCGQVNAKTPMGGYGGFKTFCWKKKTGFMPFSFETNIPVE